MKPDSPNGAKTRRETYRSPRNTQTNYFELQISASGEPDFSSRDINFPGNKISASSVLLYSEMPDKTLSKEEVNVLINGTVSSPHLDYKHLDYVVKQAIAGDQVVYRMAIRNTILLQWASLKDSEKNHIDLLNDVIPGTVLRIKRDSKRIKERLRVKNIRLTGSLRGKNRFGSKEQRNKILNGWTNLSILAGDVMNSGD